MQQSCVGLAFLFPNIPMKSNTEILIPVPELKSIAPGISKIISRRATLPVLGCVRVTSDIEGKVRLQTTDLDDFATVTLEKAEPRSASDFLVPWEPLTKAVKNCTPSDNIVLVNNGKQGVVLRTFLAGRQIEQKLDPIDVAEWPPVPQVTSPGMLVDASLRQALQEAFELSSDDPSRYVINSAYLDIADKDGHYVIGTNGRALFSSNSFNFDLEKSLIVPNRKFLSWSSFWEAEECRLSAQPKKEKDGGWVQFKTDRWSFITKEIEGNYPNWKQVIPKDTPKTTIELGEAATEEMLKFLPKLPGADRENKPIELVVTNNRLQIQARTAPDDKPVGIPVDGAQISGKNITISLNREYLIKALRFGLAGIHLIDSLSPLIFQSQGKRMVVMPLRPDAPPPAPASSQTSNKPQQTTETSNERTEMPRTAANPTATPSQTTTEPANDSAIKSVILQVEKIKESLKEVIGEFNDVLASLKVAEKEKRATEKEIDSIRATLKTIQNVKI
jgi:DNA polymerase III sliding clamp (beta) subunit (PCNA family)